MNLKLEPIPVATRTPQQASPSGLHRARVAVGPDRSREPRRRLVYIPRLAVEPAVDWSCLLQKGAHCISECGTDVGCYATCAPEAVECF
jgi:hypothetical protein